MKVIYLDQNAASFLAKSDPEPIWKKIRSALFDGFRNRNLVCPLSFEGVMETAPRPLALRQAVQSLFWQLSGAVAFKPFTNMSNELTLALIRPMPDWSPWETWKPIWAEMEGAAQKVTADWKVGKARMTERMNKFVRSSDFGASTERELFHSIAAQRSIWICNDLDCLLAGQITDNSLKCPGLVDFLIAANVNPAEIKALKHAIEYHGWAKIPIHAFEILLGAKWEYDSIRGGSAPYQPNDEIDRKRAAIALNHADIFITEGNLADLCQKAKVSE